MAVFAAGDFVRMRFGFRFLPGGSVNKARGEAWTFRPFFQTNWRHKCLTATNMNGQKKWSSQTERPGRFRFQRSESTIQKPGNLPCRLFLKWRRIMAKPMLRCGGFCFCWVEFWVFSSVYHPFFSGGVGGFLETVAYRESFVKGRSPLRITQVWDLEIAKRWGTIGCTPNSVPHGIYYSVL